MTLKVENAAKDIVFHDDDEKKVYEREITVQAKEHKKKAEEWQKGAKARDEKLRKDTIARKKREEEEGKTLAPFLADPEVPNNVKDWARKNAATAARNYKRHGRRFRDYGSERWGVYDSYSSDSYTCWAGWGNVLMADGTRKLVREVAVGDTVMCDGGAARVRATVRTRVESRRHNMLNVKGMWVTDGHPVFVDEEWTLPYKVGKRQMIDDIDYVYNFVLEEESGHTIEVDGVVAVTLGNNARVPGWTWVVHEFWGTNEVVKMLQAEPSWPAVTMSSHFDMERTWMQRQGRWSKQWEAERSELTFGNRPLVGSF